ncbi:hypothetical protein [Prosthecobacter sp.]|uniref:hypothetical protein n=1 Tax=Prosthecobacter sp. TaxID=1965333 RepID=UPI001DCA4103|nr:hypothetical protein [Prosthecobacter sp.]MCB1276721.1 hypothetical protein [Prosthecobacter sp.]
MTSLRLLLAALFATTALVSCGSFERVDARYPTVSQQDAYDVSWGLSPRKSRGNPKLKYHYNARDEYSAPVSAAPSAPAAPAPAPVVSPSPSAAPISPTIPANLR